MQDTRLQTLDLSLNRVKDSGAIRLAEFVSESRSLQSLDVSGNKVCTSFGLSCLPLFVRASFHRTHLLCMLMIDDPLDIHQIETKGMDVLLASVTTSASLATLSVAGNPGLSKCGLTLERLCTSGRLCSYILCAEISFDCCHQLGHWAIEASGRGCHEII